MPIFEVAYRNGLWWSIPAEMSQEIYFKYTNNEDVVYTWDWGDARAGSFALADGEETSVNRYKIDFQAWEQHNLDNDRRRSVRRNGLGRSRSEAFVVLHGLQTHILVPHTFPCRQG